MNSIKNNEELHFEVAGRDKNNKKNVEKGSGWLRLREIKTDCRRARIVRVDCIFRALCVL